MGIVPFRKKKIHRDLLVLVVGHEKAELLADTAESFIYHNTGQQHSFHMAFAVDHNPECAEALSKKYDHVYDAPKNNGWGRGIMRTIVHALDHSHTRGISYDHLLTIDSDTLVTGPCLNRYMELIDEETFIVGKKWGGKGKYSSVNPGPEESSLRQIRMIVKFGLYPEEELLLPDYMAAGPFVIWTRKSLDFLREIGLLPGHKFDELYPYILFPHDQMTTFILGYHPGGFREMGPSAMLYCGNVGGKEQWKQGLPSVVVQPYGEVPTFPAGTSVIHPIRAKKFDEKKVRQYFRNMRT